MYPHMYRHLVLARAGLESVENSKLNSVAYSLQILSICCIAVLLGASRIQSSAYPVAPTHVATQTSASISSASHLNTLKTDKETRQNLVLCHLLLKMLRNEHLTMSHNLSALHTHRSMSSLQWEVNFFQLAYQREKKRHTCQRLCYNLEVSQ